MQDKHEPAETFFETATSVEPRSMLAWTMLGWCMTNVFAPTTFGAIQVLRNADGGGGVSDFLEKSVMKV